MVKMPLKSRDASAIRYSRIGKIGSAQDDRELRRWLKALEKNIGFQEDQELEMDRNS